jgi:ubiquinone/menaquinone biosynthesis C-methylase UbiE
MDIEANRQFWNSTYGWEDRGEEWSAEWGGSESEWFGVIAPRIGRYVPARRILEIAPGFGRWTVYLSKHCERLQAVDLSDRCVAHCQERFSHLSHVECFSNDGLALPMIADRSIDFAFSFDSLVHAEADVIHSYLLELARTLTDEGVGFVHHSHLGAFPLETPNEHSRSRSMTADRFASYCEDSGLHCISQEMVNWIQDETIDCFSVFTKPGSRWSRPNVVRANPHFMTEATLVREMAPLYHSQNPV